MQKWKQLPELGAILLKLLRFTSVLLNLGVSIVKGWHDLFH
jgi:hypothetical protein